MAKRNKSPLIPYLNAAANLYGTLSVDDFCRIYNGYLLGRNDGKELLLWGDKVEKAMASALSGIDGDVPLDEVGFLRYEHDDGTVYVVSRDMFAREDDEGEYADDVLVNRALQDRRSQIDPVVLPEEDFLKFQDRNWLPETESVKALHDLLLKRYESIGLRRAAAEDDFATFAFLAKSCADPFALWYFVCMKLDAFLSESAEDLALVNSLLRFLRDVPVWAFLGHSRNELIELGVFTENECDAELVESVARARDKAMELAERYDGDADDDLDEGDEEDDWDDEEDDWDDEEEDEEEYDEEEEDRDGEEDEEESEEDARKRKEQEAKDRAFVATLPPAAYPDHEVDFSFVNDDAMQQKALEGFLDVQYVIADFIDYALVDEVRMSERKAAAKRLGFKKPMSGAMAIVAGLYAAFFGRDGKKSPFERLLAERDTFDVIDCAALDYLANVRYAWLEVLAVKRGLGVRCRNLVTGKELFLMEPGFSQKVDVKGLTLCGPIAPMGDVYFMPDDLRPVRFRTSESVHREVRETLGLPPEGPLSLSPEDEARFAAEAISRVYAAGGLRDV